MSAGGEDAGPLVAFGGMLAGAERWAVCLSSRADITPLATTVTGRPDQVLRDL